MGTVEDIGNLFFRATPSFRKARKERNKIKTRYRKNIRNIKRDEPVELSAGYETHWLGDRIEELHMDLEAQITNVGIEAKYKNTIYKNERRVEYYKIPEENKGEIMDTLKDIVSKVKYRNKLSLGLEFVTYSIPLVLIFSFLYFL